LPKYWNTLSRELNYDEEIYFANSKHKQAVTNHIEQDGGYFLHLSREEHQKNLLAFSLFQNQAQPNQSALLQNRTN
jgi:hypothetical protein